MVSFQIIRPASLYFLLVMTGVESQENVNVRYTLHSICALRGSTVTMGCSVRYRFFSNVKKVFWSKEESSVAVLNEASDLALDPEYRDRVRYSRGTPRDCSLTLSNVTEQDQRMYYATILMTPERRLQGRGGVDLSVTGLQVEMVPQSVVEGGGVTLTCKSSCSLTHTPMFTWYKNGHDLYSFYKSDLLLPRVSQGDEGSYSCAVQGQSYRSPAVTLNVHSIDPSKSVSVSISPSGEIVEGRPVILTCSSDANPPVEDYTWYKGTTLLRTGKIYFISRASSDDNGEYKCEARNRYGEKYSDGVVLNVLYPPKSISVSIRPSGEIVEGRPVTLTCSSDANPPVETYTWYKGTTLLRTGENYIISRASSEDSGEYKCEARNRYGEKYSDGAVLNILYPPKTVSVSVSPSGEIVEGRPVTLICRSDANPPVETYTWYKGTTFITTGKNYFIRRTSSEDSGEYKCEARNRYGENVSDGSTLNVLYPPKTVSVSISPSGEIVEGGPVTLTCSSDANPPVEEYTWYKGTTFITTGKNYVIRRTSSEDSGEYKCEARNRYGKKDSDGATLIILDPPTRVFVSISPPGEIVEGSSVTLTCSGGANSVGYTWIKGTSLIGKTKSYTFSKISSEDSGKYKCMSVNQYKEEYSDDVTVNVLYPPKIASVSISPSGEIVEGGSVKLTCSSDANPPVKYNWFKGAIFMRTGKTYTISKISCEDSGEYKCKSSNKYGEKYSKVTLQVLYAPKSVSVSIRSSGEIVEGGVVTLTCSSDANPPVETYTWYKVNESSPVGSGQSYSFTLSSNSSGWFYCVAQNKYGSQSAAAVPLTSSMSLSSGHNFSYMTVCVAVGVGLCGVGVLTAGLFCMRRTMRKRNVARRQDGGTHAEDVLYTSLEPMTRTPNDVYSTLATGPDTRPPEDTYAALEPQTISSDYSTLTAARKHH